MRLPVAAPSVTLPATPPCGSAVDAVIIASTQRGGAQKKGELATSHAAGQQLAMVRLASAIRRKLVICAAMGLASISPMSACALLEV